MTLRSASVQASFAQFINILQRRKSDLQDLGKTSLEACFMTNKSNQDKDLTFGRNFFRRKASSLSDEQKEELGKWEKEICGDGVALRPADDQEFNRLLEILERRKSDLQNLRKTGLEACFMTNQSNQDKDLKFGQNYFRRKASSLSDEQKEELGKWEKEICGDGVAVRPADDKEFNRLLEILERRKKDLQNLGKTSLEACFMTNQSNQDKDLTFGRNFFRRKASSLSDEQKEELGKWEKEICGDGVAVRPADDQEFNRLLEILERRKKDLQNLGKTSLEACFMTNQSNQDKDLKFGRNYFSRKALSSSDEQKEELGKWEKEICGDGVAVRPADDKEFNRLLEILERRKKDLQNLGKTSLEACFMTNQSNQDKDLKFGQNYFSRKALSLTEEQRQILTPFEVEICKTVNFDDFDRFVSILQDRAEELEGLGFSDFTALLSRRTLKEDPEFKFCATFWRRNASRLNSAERLQVEELQAAILRSTTDFDRVALRPAVARALDKFLNIVDRRQAEFLAVGASSVTSLFGRHIKKQDPEVRACYWFLKRIFPKLNEVQQQQVRAKLNDLLSTGHAVPRKQKYEAKLHEEETILGDALPRSRLPKSLRQLYGNSMDAETRVMPFFHRVHEVDRHMMSLEFQDCDYCHEGWFGTRIKRQDLPGGFESEAYKKTNFLQAAQTQWLDPARPICENCLLEAKRRASEGLPKEPLRFTAVTLVRHYLKRMR